MFVLIAATALAASSSASSPATKAESLKGSLQGLITADDYPLEALDRDEQGAVGFVLHIDPTGAVTSCVVEKSSGSSILDKRTCELLQQRAKFRPPKDAKGRPHSVEYRSVITWAIVEGRVPSDPWTSRIIITFAPDGRPLSCRMEFEGAIKAAASADSSCSPASLSQAPPRFADLPGAVATLVLEQSFGTRRGKAPHVPPGYILVSRHVVTLDIDAYGELTSCKVIEHSGENPDGDVCSSVSKEYFQRRAYDGWPMAFTAIETISVYVRVEKVAFRDMARATRNG